MPASWKSLDRYLRDWSEFSPLPITVTKGRLLAGCVLCSRGKTVSRVLSRWLVGWAQPLWLEKGIQVLPNGDVGCLLYFPSFASRGSIFKERHSPFLPQDSFLCK